jgi:hypothetical protein
MMTDIPICADPIPDEVIAYCRSVAPAEQSFEREKQAYVTLCLQYAKERSTRKRIVIQNLLNYLVRSKDHGMKPSYAFTEGLRSALEYEKNAEKELFPLEIHAEIANILTSATDTVGRGRTTSWTIHTGGSGTWYSQFRGEGRSAFGEWTAGEVLGSYVKFGAHHFAIGATTQRIMTMLEKRYGLDFDQLEKDRTKRK